MAQIVMADPMGAIAQATQIAGARDQLAALQEQRQYGAQDRLIALQDRERDMKMQDQKMQQASIQFAGRAATALDAVSNPAEKGAMYKQLRNMAGMQGFNVASFPPEYGPEAQKLLDVAKAQVFSKPQQELTPYQRESLDLQRKGLDVRVQESAADRAFRERQLAAQTSAGTDKPADQRAAEWYMSLPPEKQADVDRYRRGDRVTAGNEKIIYETADAAEKARQNAANYTDLATRYESSDIGSGFFGSSLPEAIKELSGNQDEYTSLRKNWAAIKASQVVANLPPGAASDADVKLALSGFIPDNADAKQVAAFLRGVGKLENLRADYESFKSDYISENKSTVGINKAWKVYAKQQGLGGPTTTSANQQAGHKVGDVIEHGGKRYRVTGGDPNDPDVEEVQ